MKLRDLITPVDPDTTGAMYLDESYARITQEQKESVLRAIRVAVEDPIAEHVETLPYPTSLTEAYMPKRIPLVPAVVQDVVISLLDDLIGEEYIVEKILLYMQLVQDIAGVVLSLYEVGWKRAMKRMGAEVETMALQIERFKREN
jgi:hypothetical protein